MPLARARRDRAHRRAGRGGDPLREDEVRQATRELVAQGSKAIVICFLQSHKKRTSEARPRRLPRRAEEVGHDIPVFASVDYYPQRKESHRMNTVLEAYAAEPAPDAQEGQRPPQAARSSTSGDGHAWRRSAGRPRSWRALVSGPIGGVIGSKLLGEALGYENIACSDIGGTSFDMALITKGNSPSPPTPTWRGWCCRCRW